MSWCLWLQAIRRVAFQFSVRKMVVYNMEGHTSPTAKCFSDAQAQLREQGRYLKRAVKKHAAASAAASAATTAAACAEAAREATASARRERWRWRRPPSRSRAPAASEGWACRTCTPREILGTRKCAGCKRRHGSGAGRRRKSRRRRRKRKSSRRKARVHCR